MTTCTCTDGTCEFCTTMAWASELEARHAARNEVIEARLAALPTRDDISEFATEEEVGNAIETALDEADMVTERDLEEYVEHSDMDRAIEEAIDGIDLDDYVKDDDLDDRITSALENADIVKDAAAGAVSAILDARAQFATKDEVAAMLQRLEERLTTADNLRRLSFTQRLRLLFAR